MKTHEDINRQWSKGSKNYDSIIHDELSSFRVEGWQKLIKSQVGDKKDVKALDIGCGPGFFTIILSKAGYNVTAIDGADGMLEKAKANVIENGVNADIKKMYCDDMDFADNSFDLVLSRNVTHALDDHNKAYKEWMRVLKPGGVLLIFDANWHLPIASKEMFKESRELVRECIEKFGSDFNGNTTFEDAEKKSDEYIAHREPHVLGDKVRPDWDMGLLSGIGFTDISYDRDITGPLWDEKEKLIYRNTPMFMLKGVKPANM